MTITINVQAVHVHCGDHGLDVACLLTTLETIMTTQAELAAQLAALTEQSEKARAEIVARIQGLEAALAASGEVAPEVLAAFEALKSSVQAADDIVPDAPV